MSATIFYSENGELSLPDEPRREEKKYKPVAPGEPLCVEIRRVALGKTEDWIGDNEILASSWAKTGGDAKPAPRLLNFYREKLKPYEAISNLGAEYFGHNLIYYTPAYGGETLRMTLEVLEIDQGGDEVAQFVKAVSGHLTRLPLFASQLPVLGAISLMPKIAEIGVKLYNLINKNDVLLKADLDLSFARPFETPLNPGRYVFVYGAVPAAAFIKKYRLSNANTLVDKDGEEASCKGGLEAPYAVIHITAEARKEYTRFEAISQQQEYLGGVISRLESKYLQQIVDLLNPIADLASQGHLVAKIATLKDEFDTTGDADRKALLVKLLAAELGKIGEGNVQDVLRSSLKGAGVTLSGTKASAAKSKASTTATESGPAVTKQSKAEAVRAAIERYDGPFRVSDLRVACPRISKAYIRRLLTKFKEEGYILRQGLGPSAAWVKAK
jgi:hypothetical protein